MGVLQSLPFHQPVSVPFDPLPPKLCCMLQRFSVQELYLFKTIYSTRKPEPNIVIQLPFSSASMYMSMHPLVLNRCISWLD
jgi:hypothetical protein